MISIALKTYKKILKIFLETFSFSVGKQQRLLKRFKTDNVDCDGHLGEDFCPKKYRAHTTRARDGKWFKLSVI
jgi:hypothetical protein